MQKIISGKTKDVFLLKDGNLLLYFKDTVTGRGREVDPGANEVVGEIKGKGNASLRLSTYFFELLQAAGLPTHFISAPPEKNGMIVRQARSFQLEVICRERAYGSFVRRYGNYIQENVSLPSLIEFTLKDDERGDPLITEDALIALQILAREEIGLIKDITRKATALLKTELAAKKMELLDIKFEFGTVDDQIVIIDEISGDCMRVLKKGKILSQQELCSLVLD